MQENMTIKLLSELGGGRPVQKRKRSLTYLEKKKVSKDPHSLDIRTHEPAQ